MRFSNFLRLLLLAILLSSCGNGKDLNKIFKLTTSAKNNTITNGTSLTLKLDPKKEIEIDSVAYFIGGKYLESKPNLTQITAPINFEKLGDKIIEAKIYTQDKTATLTDTLAVVAAQSPKLYTYEIVNTYPHNTKSYTQGLEFKNGVLYESIGEYGESALLKVDYKSGVIEERIDLEDLFFAEGLTIINNKLLQLTWKGKQGFIYDLDTFTKTGTFAYGASKEGWGLCNNGDKIYKSDGSSKIWILDTTTFAEKDFIQVADNKKIRNKYNELEWVEGKIYANTYQRDGISIIDPMSGTLEALVDLRPLKNKVQEGLDKDNEVLNGIAYNPETKTVFVTGKHWNTLFELKIIKN